MQEKNHKTQANNYNKLKFKIKDIFNDKNFQIINNNVNLTLNRCLSLIYNFYTAKLLFL